MSYCLKHGKQECAEIFATSESRSLEKFLAEQCLQTNTRWPQEYSTYHYMLCKWTLGRCHAPQAQREDCSMLLQLSPGVR
jgi:hypothetical protein